MLELFVCRCVGGVCQWGQSWGGCGVATPPEWGGGVSAAIWTVPQCVLAVAWSLSSSHSFHLTHSIMLIPSSSFLHVHSITLIPSPSFLHPHFISLLPSHSFHLTHSISLIPSHSFHHAHSFTLIPSPSMLNVCSWGVSLCSVTCGRRATTSPLESSLGDTSWPTLVGVRVEIKQSLLCAVCIVPIIWTRGTCNSCWGEKLSNDWLIDWLRDTELSCSGGY